jgi:hypothetical protein
MSDTIRIFVNATALDLPPASTVADAVAAYDPALASSVASGTVFVTDGRGIEIDGEHRLHAGSILRIVVRARRGVDADA